MVLQQAIISAGNMAMQRLVNSFEKVQMSAFTAAVRIDNFAMVPCFGFMSGLAAFTGQNVGAGEERRLRRGFRATIIMSFSAAALICAILLLFTERIASLFGLEGASLSRAVEQIRFTAGFIMEFAVTQSVSGFLQGTGDTRLLGVASAISLGLRAGLAYLAVHLGWLGYHACWVTVPVGWTFQLIIVGARYLSGAWRTKSIAGGVEDPRARRKEAEGAA